MSNHTLNFPRLVVIPNLYSHAHTYMCSRTHTHTTHISKLKEIERLHTLAKWGSGSRKKKDSLQASECNNHIFPPVSTIPYGIGPIKSFCLKPCYFYYLQCCCNYCPSFYFDLGMKIPTGIGGLDKSFNSTKPHVNP